MTRRKKSDYDWTDIHEPWLANVNTDAPVHIITARGVDKSSGSYRNAFRTACGRMITGWMNHIHGDITEWDLCKRCGDLHTFKHVHERHQAYVAMMDLERKNKDALEVAERKADAGWDVLGKKIEADIMLDLEMLVDAGNVLIPFSKSGVAWLRVLIKHRSKEIGLSAKPEDQHEFNEIQDLLDELECYQ